MKVSNITFIIMLVAVCCMRPLHSIAQKSNQEQSIHTTLNENDIARKIIGANGGEIVSIDSLVKIIIPKDAVATDTEITIQNTNSNNPAVFGFTYLITPHQLSFKMPVAIQFTYENELLDSINPQLLFVSTFENGKWMAMAGKLDPEQKSLTYYTTHFSKWCMINSIKISPRYQYLADEETSLLEVTHYGLDPKSLNSGKSMPVLAPQKMAKENVKNWRIYGRGDLAPLGNMAQYTAPKSYTNPTTDEVTVTVNYLGASFILYAWIRTLRPGLYFEADGIEYFFPNINQWYNGYLTAQSEYGSVALKINGEKATGTGQWSWKNSGQYITSFSFTTPSDEDGHFITYSSYQFPTENSIQHDCDGKVQIFYFGQPDDFVSGRFVIHNAGIFFSNKNTITKKTLVKGYFRIPHWTENKF